MVQVFTFKGFKPLQRKKVSIVHTTYRFPNSDSKEGLRNVEYIYKYWFVRYLYSKVPPFLLYKHQEG